MYKFLICFFLLTAAWATPHKKPGAWRKGQQQPDAQRVVEIQTALAAHGYPTGTNWSETQEICRGIADQMEWQTDHAPDARVLILLGLGGKNSNPDVATQKGGALDKFQREAKARREQR